MTDDTTLLQAFRCGDESAFAVLAERYHHAIHAACRRQAPTGEVEDCVQAVFLVLARRPAAAARSPVLLAWLHRVAHFVCRDARRAASRRGRAVTAVAQPPTNGHRPEAAVLEQLDAALLRLEERQRAAVLLHVNGNPTDDIAERLGVTAANASKLVQRGLASLRERLCRQGTPIGAASLATLLTVGGASAAEVAAPALSALMTQTTTTQAALLAKGASMQLTLALAKPWLIAASLVAALGTGGMVAADAVKPAPAPVAQEAEDHKIDKLLDQELTIDFQDLELAEAINALRKLSGVTFIIDAKVIAANPPPVTIRVEKMKMRHTLEFIMKLTGLQYRVQNNAIFITADDVVDQKTEKKAAVTNPAPPAITLKVTQMTAGDAVKWISELSGTPITLDPSLSPQRVSFDFQDLNLNDTLQFVAKVTGGEVKPQGDGFLITPATPTPDATPALPSAAQ